MTDDAPIPQPLAEALADRYRLERPLGAGGMATVFLAHDLRHDRKVAVKVLRPELTAILGGERFLAEIKLTANLQHPHILGLFDSGEAAGMFFYVMPFVDGETLRAKLTREKQLAVDEAIRITREVADALDYAHKQGIVHRDIKPENILLHGGHALVADFGIALAASRTDGGTRMTETGMSLGTPHYMSPEQAMGEREITGRADIYALGCVLYEMLTAEPPFSGMTVQSIMARVMTEDPRGLVAQRKSIPLHVEAAVLRALEKLPADRFATAGAFAEALVTTEFATQPMPAAARGTGPRAAVAAPRRASGLVTLGLVASTLVFAGLAAWGWMRGGEAATAPTLRSRIPASLEVGLGNDFGIQLALSPDGTRLVYASASDGVPRLWMLERNQLEAKPIPGTDQAHQPFFSPDGSKIGFVTWDRRLKVVSLTGEPPTTLVDTGIVRGGGAWGDDGYIYLSGGSRETGVSYRGIVRLSALGGEIEAVSTLDTTKREVVHNQVEVLPGSRGVLMTVQTERQYDVSRSNIAVLDLATGKHTVLLQGIIAKWSPTGHLIVVRPDGALVAAPFDLETMQLTGPATPLLEGVDVEGLGTSDIALANNGSLIYAAGGVSSANFEAVWVTREGQATPVDPEWKGRLRFPALSPDGKQLAVTVADAETQIWIKQLDRGPLSKLTFEGRSNQRATWLPDGKAVAYTSDAINNGSIFTKRADGSAGAQLALRQAKQINEVEWTRTGEWAVARIGSAPSSDLVGWRPGKDTTVTPLLMTSADEQQPSVSPDVRYLAYASNESGRFEVYVRPFPDVNSAKWQISTNGGTEPLWSRSGRELFYKDGTGRLIAAQVTPGAAFTVGEQQPLFIMQSTGGENHRTYDVTADGRRFVLIRSSTVGASETTQLVVVDNFFAELRQKVGGR